MVVMVILDDELDKEVMDALEWFWSEEYEEEKRGEKK